jgi:hypothetical protein
VNGTRPDPIDKHAGKRMLLRRRAIAFSQTKVADALGVTFQHPRSRITNRHVFRLGLRALPGGVNKARRIVLPDADVLRLVGAVIPHLGCGRHPGADPRSH